MKKIKKPVSIILSILMVVSMFAAVSVTAGAIEYSQYKVYNVEKNTILKASDKIIGDWYEDDMLDAYLVTVIDADTNNVLANAALEWTADKNYTVTDFTWQEYDSWPGYSYDELYVCVYTLTVKEASTAMTDSYYVVGSMTGWNNNDDYCLTLNQAAGTEEYMLKDVALHAEDTIKVTNSDRTKWFPGGTDNNYVVPADGTYDIYFRPNYDGNDDWYYKCLYAEKQEEPVNPFTGHSVTLGGDIGVNFFIDPASLQGAETATVKFTWDGDNEKEVDLKTAPVEGDRIKATCNVAAAQMAHKISAEVYVNGELLAQPESYSVQDYAEAVYANPQEYDTNDRPEQLKALAKALLNYGAEAQTVFADALNEKPERADANVGTADYSGVTADAVSAAINGESSDLTAVAAQLDAEFYTTSLIYLQNNTLRLYFTPASKQAGGLDGKGFDGALSDYYYYADHADIAAAELDDQQEFTVGDVTFTHSPLDYVAAVIGSSNMTETEKNLAKALFLYNQAANAYFG